VREEASAGLVSSRQTTESTLAHGGNAWNYVLIPHDWVMHGQHVVRRLVQRSEAGEP
jgi:hypothetical protein